MAMRITYISFLMFVLLSLTTLVARGEYSDPTTRVNVNEQTDLFETSVEDWGGFQDQINEQKASVLEGVEAERGLDSVVENREEVSRTASDLSSIQASDLNSRGTEEMIKSGVMNDIYVDYSRPLNKQAMVDAKKIAKGQDQLMGNLLGKLKEIGVDCETVKGPIEQEPAYYLQVETTQHKDTVYNKTICEELRNRYRCTDSVSLTCKRKGMRWGEWEDKEIMLDGIWIYRTWKGWFYPVKWTSSRHGLHLRAGHPVVKAQLREHIAQTNQVPLENIDEQVEFGARGEDPTVHAEDNLYAFNKYRVRYKIREGTEICEEWKEDWTERCSLDLVARPTSNRQGER